MTDDQFTEALYQCNFPQGDLGRPAIDFYRAMLNRLIGTSQYPPTNRDLYDLLQAGFADPAPDHDKLMREWKAMVPHLSEGAADLGIFLVEQIEWEEAEGEKVRAEMNAQMGMGGPGLPANVEPIQILACYAAMCMDFEPDEEEEEEGNEEGEDLGREEETCTWTDLVTVFYYGRQYE